MTTAMFTSTFAVLLVIYAFGILSVGLSLLTPIIGPIIGFFTGAIGFLGVRRLKKRLID